MARWSATLNGVATIALLPDREPATAASLAGAARRRSASSPGIVEAAMPSRRNGRFRMRYRSLIAGI